MFEKALEYYNKFLDSNLGWVEDNIRVCGKICDYYQSINKLEKARKYAFKSFEYDIPRAEACCKVGFSFICENNFNNGIFWYKIATELEKPTNNWGFFNDACWTWLPHLQLCLCYDRLRNQKLAYVHNEIAYKFNPNDKSILYNKKYFENLGFK